METYESIIELIKKNPDIINFGEIGHGASELWIKKAEARLNVIFPPSYIWWLKNYSGGEVLGEEIFSVYEMDFDTVVGGDIVYVNELNRKIIVLWGCKSIVEVFKISITGKAIESGGIIFPYNIHETARRKLPRIIGIYGKGVIILISISSVS